MAKIDPETLKSPGALQMWRPMLALLEGRAVLGGGTLLHGSHLHTSTQNMYFHTEIMRFADNAVSGSVDSTFYWASPCKLTRRMQCICT